MHRTRRHRSGTHAPRPRPTSLPCLVLLPCAPLPRGTRKFRIIIMHSRNYLQFLNHLEISSAPKDDALSRPLPPSPAVPPLKQCPFSAAVHCNPNSNPCLVWPAPHRECVKRTSRTTGTPLPLPLWSTPFPLGLISAAPCRLAGCMADYWLKML